ncbi:latent-transforming growth factor beta-binding protein 1-like [Heteronotia binoei]|uniref:latent-transforming growth factor beta-binding protein 1-like n=1 Tax=Heteronotia binoei TaxID=13085 RepID=UPI0029310DAC|nr:latent-transforming growth factor beta-binding protein 1-like [Heteronotia binoei]
MTKRGSNALFCLEKKEQHSRKQRKAKGITLVLCKTGNCFPLLFASRVCGVWLAARIFSALEMAWIKWWFLLCACIFLAPTFGVSEKGRLRTITYVLRPNQSGTSSSRLQSGGQQPRTTFNVELNTRYSTRGGGSSSSTLERTRRMSKASSPSMQLRLGPTVQLQHKPASHTPASFSKVAKPGSRSKLQPRESNNSTVSGQVHPKPHLQQLQGVNVCGGQCCHGWSKAPGSQRCTKQVMFIQPWMSLQECIRCFETSQLRIPAMTHTFIRCVFRKKNSLCLHSYDKGKAVWKKIEMVAIFLPLTTKKSNCSPPCQNGGMCLRPQLCVCKPGTKGSSCEDTTKQETTLLGGPGPATPPWPIPQRSVQQSYSKKVQVQQKVNPMAQMTFTLKQKPSGGLPQQMQSQ